MRRLFWVALGATAGVVVVRRLTKAADNLTPEGAADQLSRALGRLSGGIREFADDVKAGMTERDNELREALGISENGANANGEPDSAAVDHILSNNQRRGTF